MKIFYMLGLLFVTFFVSSCLTQRVIQYTIDFAEDFDSGTLTVTYDDIRSSEKEIEKQQEDFKELILLYKEDKFLLDQVEEGVYVKERELYEKNGVLNGHYKGIFQKLKINNSELTAKNDERFLLMETDPMEKIESNGKILRTEFNILLVWPKDQKNIWFKIINTKYDERAYPLIEYYQEWTK